MAVHIVPGKYTFIIKHWALLCFTFVLSLFSQYVKALYQKMLFSVLCQNLTQHAQGKSNKVGKASCIPCLKLYCVLIIEF